MNVSDSASTPITMRALHSTAEARRCAEFIVTSEPWITLGLTLEVAIQRLTDPTREIHVATVDGQIVGVLVLFLDSVVKGYIQTIAVHPDWRSRGIGAQMIRFAEERIFRISPNVFLCVSSFNHGAQRLYERLGYERVGTLKDFVVKGYDEFIMRKSRGPLQEFRPAS